MKIFYLLSSECVQKIKFHIFNSIVLFYYSLFKIYQQFIFREINKKYNLLYFEAYLMRSAIITTSPSEAIKK